MQPNSKLLARYTLMASVTLALLFNFFFFEKVLGISLFMFTSIAVGTFLFGKFIKQNNFMVSTTDLLFIPLLLVSMVPFLAQNGFISAVAMISVIWGLPYIGFLSMKGEEVWKFGLGNSISTNFGRMTTQFGAFRGYASAGKPVKASEGEAAEQKSASQFSGVALKIVLGILLAAPVLIVLLLLLGAADPAFGKILDPTSFLSSLFNISSMWSVIVFLIVLAITISLITNWYFSDGEYFKPPGPGKFLDPIIAAVFSISINLVLLVFVLVQFVYLFGGEDRILSQGFTYADYARRGFFELTLVALLVMSIVYFINRARSNNSMVATVVLKASLIAKILFTFVILVSALFRMNLYTSSYGLTELRLYVQMTIIFMALVFGFMIVGLIADKVMKYLGVFNFTVACLLLFGLAVINPDAHIVNTNIGLAESGQREFDSRYVSENLSSDGLVYLVSSDELIEQYSGFSAQIYKCNIVRVWEDEQKHRSSFQELNLRRLLNANAMERFVEANASCLSDHTI